MGCGATTGTIQTNPKNINKDTKLLKSSKSPSKLNYSSVKEETALPKQSKHSLPQIFTFFDQQTPKQPTKTTHSVRSSTKLLKIKTSKKIGVNPQSTLSPPRQSSKI